MVRKPLYTDQELEGVRLLRIREAADVLGIPVRSFYRLIAAGVFIVMRA